MKRLLFTFFAIMLLGTSWVWGAEASKSIKNNDLGWTAGQTYTSFNLDNVISVTTSGKVSGGNNNGLYTNSCWYIYYNSPTKGKFTISAKSGYIIQTVAITYSANNNAKIKNTTTSANWNSTYVGTVNDDSVSFIVTNDMVKVQQFVVTYAAKTMATAITMENAMTVSVGNHFQIGTLTPNGAYCDWTSSDASKVSVDKYGVITAKAVTTTPVNIKAKVNGVDKTCAVTVVAKTGTDITETFSKAEISTTWQGQGDNPYSVNGDNDLLHWIMRSTRRATSDKVDGVQATRISYNSGTNYIAYNNSNTYPAEGGVKRVSFKWVAASGTNPVVFDVDNNGQPEGVWISHHTYLPMSSVWTSTQTFTKDVNMAKNAQFRIKLMASGVSAVAATLNISPITITPYLLFTNKAVTATNGFYKFNDDDLINNTGTTLAKANFTVSDANAASIDDDGTIRSKQDNKTITLTAKWGDVTTTTKLTTKLIDPAGSFALGADVITKNIGDEDFDNAFNKTVGDAFTYKSTNEDVATVDENGKVHIVNGGTTQIKAVFAVSAPYKAKEFAYTLDVNYTPTEPYFAESFDSIQVGTKVSLNAPKVFGGNGGVYRWKWTNTERLENEKIDTYQSPKIINNYGEIAMTDVAEGGIKEVAFRYKTKNSNLRFHFYVKVGDKEIEMDRVGTANIMSFAHQFNMADSVGLSIYMKETDSPLQTHLLIDTVKIVPYLLYTQKVVAASAAGGAYTNTALINNITPGDKPVYSISCPTDVAEIHPETGAVTIKKSDTVTVTATWGKVKTTYTLQMQAKPIPEISFAEEAPNIDLLAGEFTNELTTPAGIGDTTYTSSNEDVATVDVKTGVVTMHSIGQTTITVNIAENTTYAATSKSYDLTVGFTPETGTFWTETFSKVPVVKNWTGTDKYVGDSSVYNWAMTYYQRQSDDMVGTYQGTRIRYSGALAMDGVQEGGVKAVRFDYRAANQVDSIHFKVNVDNTDYEYKHDAITVKGTIVSYARKFEVKKNTQFAINMDAVHTPAQGYPIVGPITITPYLLYTDKKDTIELADYQGDTKYTNDKLINNTGVIVQAGQTDIEFSVVDESEDTKKVATVNKETGAVTPVGGGTIKIQAKWGNVTTTYELTIKKMDYTPAFAKTEETKTMNDSTFSIQLNDVPADAGSRTYSSTNERVAKVNNDGKVTVYGPGTTDIKVEIAENAKYKKQSTKFTLTVTEPTTDTDITEGFLGLTWGEDATSLNGDLCTWNTYKTRRTTKNDSIVSKGVKMGAEWMQGETALGYLESDGAVEGGVKRIYFTWIKNAIESPATGDPTFMVKVGDVEDVFNAKDSTQSTPHVYLHNFNLRENSVIKIYNNSSSNFKAGPIVITPYIFFTEDLDVQYASVKSITFSNTYFVNNTEDKGVLTFKSSDETVATVTNEGVITPKKANETPITITATWKPEAGSNDSVTASYKLIMHDKSPREAYFDNEKLSVQRGETPVNELHMNNKTSVAPIVTYSSSDTQVAIIEGGVVKTICPGVTTIKAVIQETDKYLADSVTYELTVNYAPADGTYFTETFSQAVASGYKQGPDTITGSYGFYQWGLKRYRRNTTSDLVAGEQGTRICYDEDKSDAYIATIGAQEGGLKEVVFDYCVPGMANLPIHFFVQAGDSTHEYYHVPMSSSTVVTPYAHVFSEKSNTTLSIYVNKKEATPQSAITVSPVKIVPYLLYTRKDTTVYAKDCENFEFINDSLIDNTNSEGTITYSVPDDNGVASIDGAGKITILGEGDVTVTATWKPSSESEDVVTTTYQLHIVLETTSLTFAEGEVVKQLKSDPEQDWYQQQATLSPEAVGTFTYSIVDDPEGASINPSNGIVTYTAPGTYVIKATFAQQLPYKASEDTYTLIVNSLPTPTIEFNDVNKTMNDAPFINPMKETLTGLGNAHYSSSDKAVATVVEGTGEVTIVGEGTATISVHFDEGTAYAEGDGSYTLTVTDPNDAAVIETYPGLPAAYAYEVKTLDGKVTSWDYLKVRHANSDVMADNSYAARYGNAPDAYVVTKDEFEGGIKRVSFKWNKASPDVRTVSFRVSAGEEAKDSLTQTVGVKGQTLLSTDVPYNHNFLVKKNAKLQICSKSDGTGNGCYLLVGAVKITPYLRFKGAKVVDADLDKVTEFNLNDTIINNTEGGTINFAVDSFKTNVAPTIENGKVTFTGITKGGKVYISATWAENPGVKTTLVINTTIKPQISFAVPAPADQNLIDGSYTNALNKPEGAGAVTYTSSNKQVATVDNEGKVTFIVAGTTTIKAKVAASDIYKADSLTYTLNIKGYAPAEGEAWVETFSLMQHQDPYATTEQAIAGDSSVYSWKAKDYIRPDVKKPFRLHTNGYIKTNGNQEGGIKYVALNWIAAATGNIDFTMKVNNDSYQYKGGVTVNKAYRFEHFFNADSIVPLEIKIGSKDITAYMSVVNVTVVPYLLYTEKQASIKIGETYTNENLINNLEGADKTAVQYAIVEGDEYATIEGNVVTGIKATPANKTVKVKAYLNANLYTTYTLTVTSSSEITLDEEANNSTIIASYAGVENMTVNLTRTLAAGKFNTFCVPFDVTMEQLEEVLGEDNIKRLATLDEDANATLDDSHKNLNIVIKDAESIEAGKPYLLWLENEVKDPTFSNVTISTDNEGISSKDNKVTFYGITSPKTIGKDQKSILFVSNNNLKWNGTGKDSDMKGLRAYFDVPDLDESSGVAPRLVMRQPSAPTELMNVNANVNANKVLINDRIYIIRNGVYYDLNGQIVK